MICAFAILFASCSGGREAATHIERIVFLGDSITASGDELGGYVSLVKDSLIQSSKGHIQVIGAGISGNRVPDLLARVDHDVIAQKPTLTIIYIGINDVWHWACSTAARRKAEYEAGLKELIGKIQAAGSKVILCTPSVIGEKRAGTNPSDSLLGGVCWYQPIRCTGDARAAPPTSMQLLPLTLRRTIRRMPRKES